MEDQIFELAKAHGLDLKQVLHINEIGLDYRVVQATDNSHQTWILRIPRRNDLEVSMNHEKRILQFLKPRCHFQVPDWKIANPSLIAYPILKGNIALEVEPNTYKLTWNINEKSLVFSKNFGKILSQLQQISPQEAEQNGFRSQSIPELRKTFFENIKTVDSELGISETLKTRWKIWLDTDNYWPQHTRIVHGDLYAGHILTTKDESISGIIDWSECEISDPSIDFVGHYAGFGEELLDQTLKSYQEHGGILWPRIKDHIVERNSISPLRYALFALKTKNDQHLAAAKQQLHIPQ